MRSRRARPSDGPSYVVYRDFYPTNALLALIDADDIQTRISLACAAALLDLQVRWALPRSSHRQSLGRGIRGHRLGRGMKGDLPNAALLD